MIEPIVCQNHNSHVAIELRRTPKKVTAILKGDGNVRRVKEISPADFDKNWKPLADSSVTSAAIKWLEYGYNNYIPLSEGAKKELIMILVIKHLAVIGKFPESELEIASEEATVVTCIETLCELYSGKELQIIYNSMKPEKTLTVGDKVRSKPELAKEIFEMAEKFMLEVKQPAASKPPKTEEGEGVKKVSGIKKQIREMLVAGEAHTLEELVAKFGEDKKTSITTALSDLKSEKYCGEGGVLNIIRNEDKQYTLKPADAE